MVTQGSDMTRILLLGGTTEARRMAKTLAESGLDAVFSYAGRTNNPMVQPIPTRMGGFGGVDGLVDYLQAERITHVIDATHPFAAQMSSNAVHACAEAGVVLSALERSAWAPEAGDDWQCVPHMEGALAALPDDPTRVFLAIGRLNLDLFAAKPQHHYLLRLVDEPTEPLPLPNARAVIARGPFTFDGDLALLRDHKTQLIVAKNGGGAGARAKLDAARDLGLPVIMIDRPAVPERQVLGSVPEVMAWLGQEADRGV